MADEQIQPADTLRFFIESPWLRDITSASNGLVSSETTCYVGLNRPVESPQIQIEPVKG